MEQMDKPMPDPIERFLKRLPTFRHRVRDLLETDESFASLTREYDKAADAEEHLVGGGAPAKAEKSRTHLSMIEKDIVARLESSSRIL